MPAYLCCPLKGCWQRENSTPAAAERMTDHLVIEHGFPEVSASYQANLLQPVAVPQAA